MFAALEAQVNSGFACNIPPDIAWAGTYLARQAMSLLYPTVCSPHAEPKYLLSEVTLHRLPASRASPKTGCCHYRSCRAMLNGSNSGTLLAKLRSAVASCQQIFCDLFHML
ncbi:TPA: hypothetical protein ACH3X1_010516 [Trebouxia sp. C0004]